MRQRDRTGFSRHAVRGEAVQQRKGVRAFDQHFRKGGHIHDANRFTHGLHLGCYDVIDCGSIEGIVILLRRAVASEPTGPFKSVDLFMHRTFGFQQAVKR